MTTAIVTVNASVVLAPVPNTLQQTGALISQGGTNTSPNTLTQVSTLAELTAILAAPKSLSSLTWLSSVVTGTTTAPHGWTNGDVIGAVIAGTTPSAYNGSYQITITGASTFTYPLVSNPGTSPASVPGTVLLADEAELLAMGTTYFAGNGVLSVNVLELGEGTAAEGVAALSTYIAGAFGGPNQQYAYLVPREWDNNSTFIALATTFTAVNAKQYFYVTTTVANRAVYATIKSVLAEIDTPGIGATEFPTASAFGTALKAAPSSSNKVPPLSYAPAFGVTPYPLQGNATIFNELSAANVGWIGTGQEGGISTPILFQGKMSDGNAWNFWYSVDWAQINMNLALANEVINGSATTLNPLYYNQAGINRLQNRAVQTANQGVTAGLGNGQVVATKLPIADFLTNYNAGLYAGQIVINAEPFVAYSQENPNDYGIQKYAGISCIWIPQLGFLNVFFNLQATTLIA